MTYRRNVVEEISEDISAYLTEEERMCLLSDLHMALTWVGIKIPENIKVDQGVLSNEIGEHGLKEKDQPPEVHLTNGTVNLRALIGGRLTRMSLQRRKKPR